MNRLEIKIPLPESLKVKLIDDWENVTRNNAVCIRIEFNQKQFTLVTLMSFIVVIEITSEIYCCRNLE